MGAFGDDGMCTYLHHECLILCVMQIDDSIQTGDWTRLAAVFSSFLALAFKVLLCACTAFMFDYFFGVDKGQKQQGDSFDCSSERCAKAIDLLHVCNIVMSNCCC